MPIIFAINDNKNNIESLKKIIKKMVHLSLMKNNSASGIFFYAENKINVFKDSFLFSTFLKYFILNIQFNFLIELN